MPEPICIAEVRLWQQRVGGVAELDDGQIVFEYDNAFRRSGLQISPRNLPLEQRGPRTFPELRHLEAFAGLPGVLADVLPDRFGNAIIRKYFADRGRPGDALSPVQRLLYIGSRAMGALELHPPLDPRRTREEEALEVATLVEQARRVIEGRTDVAIPEIMRLGSSAGGARAKAVILWNRESNEVRSAFARARDGDEPWLIKFDGVGELGDPNPDPQPYNRIEYAYSCLARRAGIDMAETFLLEERSLAHFMTRRFDRVVARTQAFDRVDGRRLHLHTLGGMEHVDYNVPGLYSYEQYLRLVLALNLGYPALEQAFRRVCFNLLAVNQDDHVKNFSFLMDEQGHWGLAPAYDLTFARGRGYTSAHQLSLAGKRDGFTAADLLAVGEHFGLAGSGRILIQEVGEALGHWPEVAREAGVPADRIAALAGSFRLHCVPG